MDEAGSERLEQRRASLLRAKAAAAHGLAVVEERMKDKQYDKEREHFTAASRPSAR